MIPPTASAIEAPLAVQAVTDARARPLRDLRLSLTDRCNLHCQYCMPEEVFGQRFHFSHRDDLLSLAQLVRLVESFTALGVEKIRLTGGEPLLRPDVVEIVHAIRSTAPDVDLALTTNGLFLPKFAAQLARAGLDRVNISLDGIHPAIASKMAGRAIEPMAILRAGDTAREAGLGVKFNAVIKRSINATEVLPLAMACRDRGFTLRYIEYMDVGSVNGWQRSEVVSGAELRKMLNPLAPLKALPSASPSEVARYYTYEDTGQVVGFIESVSRPFCGGCTRARISATGELFTCLFAQKGTPLKPMLLQQDTLQRYLKQRWQTRHDRYSEERNHTSAPATPHEEMWRLGG